ncbi:MAG: hypothetical protein L7H18_01275 [Candidatus Nealsonbacteria bacterium DGGOD1a]|jgi:hypothetical protein|nr:MAG: hypothetical protein L7H18_01275 [Candidatus Nealsonbacteria bacterium DGGOD1a]
MSEYVISKTEINRRKKAYATLSISLIVGQILASMILDFPITIVNYFYFIIAFFLLGVLSFRSLNFLLHAKIVLSTQLLERINNKTIERFIIANIVRVKIKRTTKNTIREIYIWLRDGKSVFISAIENFEQFKDDLISKLDKNVAVKEIHEPIYFDHPLFYSILGLPISFIGIYLIKLITNFDYAKIGIVLLTFLVYLFAVGIYFIYAKPISKRYGEQTRIIDFLLGAFMVCSGIMCIVLIKMA